MVPSELVESYRKATNWCELLPTDHIVPLEDGAIFCKERYGMEFDATENVVVNGIFPEGKRGSLISVKSSNESVVNVTQNEFSCDQDTGIFSLNFVINTMRKEGTAEVIITLQSDEKVIEKKILVTAFESIPLSSYVVENVEGAKYNFTLNEDGYYESGNKGVAGSAALCKITVNMSGWDSLSIECINSGETRCDYGVLSIVNSTGLSPNNTTDAADQIYHSFSSASDITTTKEIEYGVLTPGTYIIYAKYRKDFGIDKGNDSLQFKVVLK